MRYCRGGWRLGLPFCIKTDGMVTGARITPVAIIIALVVMIAALLYAAINRTHEVGPTAPPPIHKTR